MNAVELASMIDHTCLAPDAMVRDIERLCAEAVRYGCYGVCVAPARVSLAVRLLADEEVNVCTVAGFPHGNTIPRAKIAEAEAALEMGAREIDMVMQIGALKDGDTILVRDEILRMADTVHARAGALLKVIVETPLLNDDEIALACRVAVDAGADFVKTSTGFAGAGATIDAVRLMRSAVGDGPGIKAAGGIRDYDTAVAMVEAGATRIGASASVQIIKAATSS